MKAIVTTIKGYEVECNVKRDRNKLILEFDNIHNVVPYPILGVGDFNVNLKPTEKEIGCGDCNTCMTPIC
jgi:hypothetical protein